MGFSRVSSGIFWWVFLGAIEGVFSNGSNLFNLGFFWVFLVFWVFFSKLSLFKNPKKTQTNSLCFCSIRQSFLSRYLTQYAWSNPVDKVVRTRVILNVRRILNVRYKLSVHLNSIQVYIPYWCIRLRVTLRAHENIRLHRCGRRGRGFE